MSWFRERTWVYAGVSVADVSTSRHQVVFTVGVRVSALMGVSFQTVGRERCARGARGAVPPGGRTVPGGAVSP
ncbi:hypothetical protein Slu03_07680 [Sediminihabitans luteus]|nr:hypothetical protein Slu03_07680 [Sediminihabitans luteus]